MPTKTTVKIDPGFEAAVLRSADVRKVVEAETTEVAEEAKRRSQWGNGSIAKGIKVEVGVEKGQIIGRVNATDFKSHWFQFGTSKMRARPFLTDAAEAKGYKIEAAKK